MSKIKLKKLSLQYSYLKLEKEEVDVACKDSEKDIRSYLQKKYPDYYDSIFGAPKPSNDLPSQSNLSENELSEEQDIKPSVQKNKDTKKLYRRIVEKTHPDKVGDNSQSDTFLEATRAYENQDVAMLLEIAASLNIEMTSLHPETLILLENNVKTISEDINTKKSSVSWAWSQAENDEKKEELLKIILRSKGII